MLNSARPPMTRWAMAARLMIGAGLMHASVMVVLAVVDGSLTGVLAADLVLPIAAFLIGLLLGDCGRGTWTLVGLVPSILLALVAWSDVAPNLRGMITGHLLLRLAGAIALLLLVAAIGEALGERRLRGRRAPTRAPEGTVPR